MCTLIDMQVWLQGWQMSLLDMMHWPYVVSTTSSFFKVVWLLNTWQARCWATDIGHFDMWHEVPFLSLYQALPREGHMEQLLHIYAYWKQVDCVTLYLDPTRQWTDCTKNLYRGHHTYTLQTPNVCCTSHWSWRSYQDIFMPDPAYVLWDSESVR